ncbi:MAG: hypothetical protein R3D45_12695 [Rhizobiaceae bacterium]
MRKSIIVLAAIMGMTGCSTLERDASLGAAAGGAIGALATGRLGGALAGAAIGAGTAVLVGQATRKGYCIYRDPRTLKTYEARCRAG